MLGWGFYIVGLAASIAGMYFVATRFHLALSLLLLPIAAWFVARILVESGATSLHWLRQGQMAKWNGRYYEFAGRQLRAVEIEGMITLVERDVLEAVGLDDPATLKLFGPAERVVDADSGHWVLTRKGCEHLLKKSTQPDAGRLYLWLEREVFRPYEKRRAL